MSIMHARDQGTVCWNDSATHSASFQNCRQTGEGDARSVDPFFRLFTAKKIYGGSSCIHAGKVLGRKRMYICDRGRRVPKVV
jgi:hypothetical protein